MSSTPLLRLKGAHFGYDRKAVLSEVDLEVHAGEVFGIIGPNGAGKTTLFRGLLGLLPTQGGEVHRAPGPIGYVPQRMELDPVYPLTALELVEMGAYGSFSGWHKLTRTLSRPDRERALESLALMDLEAEARTPFAQLSGGQRQRVLIARALMVQPVLLLLDEPTAGVDQSAADTILKVLRELAERKHIAILMVAHQVEQLRTIADEVLLVRDGKLERGPAREWLQPEKLEQLYSLSTNSRKD